MSTIRRLVRELVRGAAARRAAERHLAEVSIRVESLIAEMRDWRVARDAAEARNREILRQWIEAGGDRGGHDDAAGR